MSLHVLMMGIKNLFISLRIKNHDYANNLDYQLFLINSLTSSNFDDKKPYFNRFLRALGFCCILKYIERSNEVCEIWPTISFTSGDKRITFFQHNWIKLRPKNLILNGIYEIKKWNLYCWNAWIKGRLHTDRNFLMFLHMWAFGHLMENFFRKWDEVTFANCNLTIHEWRTCYRRMNASSQWPRSDKMR